MLRRTPMLWKDMLINGILMNPFQSFLNLTLCLCVKDKEEEKLMISHNTFDWKLSLIYFVCTVFLTHEVAQKDWTGHTLSHTRPTRLVRSSSPTVDSALNGSGAPCQLVEFVLRECWIITIFDTYNCWFHLELHTMI